MKEFLNKIKQQIATFPIFEKISDEEWEIAKSKTTVLLLAGGESSRFTEVLQGQQINKVVYPLTNGDTMIEMAIRLFAVSGISNFCVSLYHHSPSVESVVGDGSKWGVNIKYVYDGDKAIGKGGAIAKAYRDGALPLDDYVVVYNVDDVIVNYPGDFARDFISAHIQGEKTGHSVTINCVAESPYQFSGLSVENGTVTEMEYYPMVPIPAHTGLSINSGKIARLMLDKFKEGEKHEFEGEVWPPLAKEGELFAWNIPTECWIAVNNLKGYKQLCKYLETVSA